MGIYCAGCRNVVVQWMSIFRTHGRWLSVSADGYHFGSHGGDLRIIHSNCDGTGDDCIGVGHLIHRVRSINGNSMRISTIVRAVRLINSHTNVSNEIICIFRCCLRTADGALACWRCIDIWEARNSIPAIPYTPHHKSSTRLPKFALGRLL